MFQQIFVKNCSFGERTTNTYTWPKWRQSILTVLLVHHLVKFLQNKFNKSMNCPKHNFSFKSKVTCVSFWLKSGICYHIKNILVFLRESRKSNFFLTHWRILNEYSKAQTAPGICHVYFVYYNTLSVQITAWTQEMPEFVCVSHFLFPFRLTFTIRLLAGMPFFFFSILYTKGVLPHDFTQLKTKWNPNGNPAEWDNNPFNAPVLGHNIHCLQSWLPLGYATQPTAWRLTYNISMIYFSKYPMGLYLMDLKLYVL